MRRDKRWLLLVTLVLILSSTACGAEPTAAPEGVAEPTAAPEGVTKPTPTPIAEEGPAPEPTPTPVREAAARFETLDYNMFLDGEDLWVVGIIENIGDAAGQAQQVNLVDGSDKVIVEIRRCSIPQNSSSRASPISA